MQQVGENLKELRTPYEAALREVGDHFKPTRTRFSKGSDHRAKNRFNRELLNSRPRLSLRTAQNGMQTGMTSPARPWFRLIAQNPAFREDDMAKAHLYAAMVEMRQMMQSSGLYNALHTLWGDLLWSGTDAMILEDDPTSGGLRPLTLVPGEYWLGSGSDNRVDTIYREIKMTIQQVVGKFVYNNVRYSKPMWDVVSRDVQKSWEQGDYARTIDVCHIIMPRMERDIRSWLPSNMPFASIYWAKDEMSDKKLLGNLGYTRNPLIASRWDVDGNNVYGTSPAMDAMPDVRSLQTQERDKREAVRRMNRPPMNAPVELRNSAYSLMPEAVNFMADPTKGMTPAMQVNPPLQHLQNEIDITEARIDEGLYAQLFLMISRLDRRQITAREIDERHEEKLIGLGPVLERQHVEKLGPLIKAFYLAAVRSGRVPPLPDRLAQMPVEIDYISMLAQAQKAVATGGMERLYGFVGNLAAADENVLDITDNDKAVREYGEMLGVPADIMRSSDDVAARREQRSQAVAQENALQQVSTAAPAMKATADAAKLMAETDKTGKPVDILRNLGLV